MITTLLLSEARLRRAALPLAPFWSAATWALISGVITARLYHVWTDWPYYADQPGMALLIWRGGLSIIGGGFGVALGLLLWKQWERKHLRVLSKIMLQKSSPLPSPKPSITVLQLCDAVAFAAPFGQAIGRLGNYFNQELFGPPTTLPWGIFIDAAHRPTLFLAATHFHPLFAYEALAMLSFGSLLWLTAPVTRRAFGTGAFAASYVLFYTIIRFFLDFLRVEKSMIGGTLLSINQGMMIAVFASVFVVCCVKTVRQHPS